MSKNTSKKSGKIISDLYIKAHEKVRCILCGHTVPFRQFESTYKLEIMLQLFGGYKGLDWKVKQEGYISLKKFLRSKLQALLDYDLSLDNGCDFYPDCAQCLRRRTVLCTNEQRGLAWRLRLKERAGKVKARKAQGATIDQLAKEFGVSTKTIKRDLKEGD